jgi:hypothetical protein
MNKGSVEVKGKIPPHALPFSIIPHSLQELFIQAFTKQERPAASAWVDSLAKLKGALLRCPSNHHYFGQECCWCRFARKYQIDYFAQKPQGSVIRTEPVDPCEESLISHSLMPLVLAGFYYCPPLLPFLFITILCAPQISKKVRGWRRKLRY